MAYQLSASKLQTYHRRPQSDYFRYELGLGAYNNLGNLHLAAKDLTGAKTAYEMALQIDPNFAAGHYNLGMTLKAQGVSKMRSQLTSKRLC